MKNKRILSKMDKPLLIMMILYSIIGVLLVLSASSVSSVLMYGESPYYFFIKQTILVTIGYFVGFVIIIKVPTKLYKKVLPFALIGILTALVFLLLYGTFVSGAKSWINIGPYPFQPSEFAKSIIIIYMGVFFGQLQNKKHGKNAFFIPIAFSIIIFLLVAFQPDLGTAVIIAGIVFFTFLSIPLKDNSIAKALKIAAGALIVVMIVFLLTGTEFLTEEQLSRFNYREPCTRYTDKTGYQVCNGFIAINNGGLLGKGIGNSTQKYLYLPEAHTDFIFAIGVEELGVIWGFAVIIGYAFILYRILLISKSASNLRNSIISYGVFVYITMHLIINFCGILALVPLTGVPVPFLSYGGSFALNMIGCLFIVQRIAIENKIDKSHEEIKNIK